MHTDNHVIMVLNWPMGTCFVKCSKCKQHKIFQFSKFSVCMWNICSRRMLKITFNNISLFSFVPCSEKIHSAVTEMASLFPKVSSLCKCFISFFVCVSLSSFLSSLICFTSQTIHRVSSDSLHFSVAPGIGCSPLLPPAVGFQCLTVAGGVP